MDRQRSVECAVLYTKADGVFRYCVVPHDDRLEVPGGKNQELSGWVEDQQWSWAAPEEIRMPGGETVEAPMLDVHVGEWPTAEVDRRSVLPSRYRLAVPGRVGRADAYVHGLQRGAVPVSGRSVSG